MALSLTASRFSRRLAILSSSSSSSPPSSSLNHMVDASFNFDRAYHENRRQFSYRAWNVVRYHADFNQSIRLISDATMSDSAIAYRPNDLLIRVLASSVNAHDIAMTRGYGNTLLSLPNIIGARQSGSGGGEIETGNRAFGGTLGRDFVGRVVARGAAVSEFKQGDLVWGTVPPYAAQGAHADYVITGQNFVAHKPKNLTNLEAASIPYVGLTAWSALSTFGELNATNAVNKRVLVLGGSGGVGCFAIQLLKTWGAKVVTTCSRGSVDWLRSLTGSADVEFVDYRDTDRFLRSYPVTFDFILDASSPIAARRNHSTLRSIAARNAGFGDKIFAVDENENAENREPSAAIEPETGIFDAARTRYVTLTSPWLPELKSTDSNEVDLGTRTEGAEFAPPPPPPPLVPTMADAITDSLSFATAPQHDGLRFRWAHYLPNPKALKHIGDLMERGAIKPLTTNVYAFDDAIVAYESLEYRPLIGKVVLNNGANL